MDYLKDVLIINTNKIKQADLAVGIPSFNEADNIGFVVEQIDRGLAANYKNSTKVIVNADNNSHDGTKEIFLAAKTKTPKIYISTRPGISGKGNNFFNFFNLILSLKTRAAAVVDADLKSVNPSWVKYLLEPILKGYDYATPYYARNEYDGSITNHICYPLIYGLFGYDLRQPIGGDFSFSSDLTSYWLGRKWHKTTKKYGIDIFMTMNAVNGGYKKAQVGLGAKIHKPSAPKLGPMFSQVVTTLFKNLKISKRRWLCKIDKKKLPLFGLKEFDRPQTLSVDYKGMKAAAIFNFSANEEIYRHCLSKDSYHQLKKMYHKNEIAIDELLWSRIIYDAYYAYDRGDLGAGIIEALKPLYFGRFVSFYKETLEESSVVCEKKIKKQALVFWDNRDYLIKKYSK